MNRTVPAWLEPYLIRGKTLTRTLIGVSGLLLALVGMYNMFVPVVTSLPTVAPYRVVGYVVADTQTTAGYFVGDILLIAIGAIIAWRA